jgi:hypothetical protein
MKHKIEIKNIKDSFQRFNDNYVIVLYKTDLLVAQGFNSWTQAKLWVESYNNSHDDYDLELKLNDTKTKKTI